VAGELITAVAAFGATIVPAAPDPVITGAVVDGTVVARDAPSRVRPV
jgi:hypothetical protein